MEQKICDHVFSFMNIEHLYLHKELVHLAVLLHLVPTAAQNMDPLAVW